MKPELFYLRPEGLRPYVEELRRLEASISYPVDEGRDSFTIDHGRDYHGFFSTMGDAHFLLAIEGGEVVGSIAGVFKMIRRGNRQARAVYVGDFKVAPHCRGTGLARRMMWRCLFEAARTLSPFESRDRSLLDWELAFGGAMRGERGDVTRSARGLHVMRMTSSLTSLDLYFVDPETLAGLDPRSCPLNPTLDGVDFSPLATDGPEDLLSTTGRKDLRLASTSLPWPLVHLPRGPQGWHPTLGHYLQRAGAQLVSERGSLWPEGALACFALDPRQGPQIAWLEARGITPGAVCTVYTLPRTGFARKASWYHLATSEI